MSPSTNENQDFIAAGKLWAAVSEASEVLFGVARSSASNVCSQPLLRRFSRPSSYPASENSTLLGGDLSYFGAVSSTSGSLRRRVSVSVDPSDLQTRERRRGERRREKGDAGRTSKGSWGDVVESADTKVCVHAAVDTMPYFKAGMGKCYQEDAELSAGRRARSYCQ